MRVFEAPFKTIRGALEQTLLALGYTPSYGKNEFGFPFVTYHHRESDAIITLPAASADEPLDDGDLLRAEHSVEWWGIADVTTFYRLLKDATPTEMQIVA